MMKFLLFISAIFWLMVALILVVKAIRKKIQNDYLVALLPLLVAVVVGLHALGIVNLKLIVGIILACQFWAGLFMLFDGVTKGPEQPVISAISGAVIFFAAALWLIYEFQLWALLLCAGVIACALALLVLFWKKFRD